MDQHLILLGKRIWRELSKLLQEQQKRIQTVAEHCETRDRATEGEPRRLVVRVEFPKEAIEQYKANQQRSSRLQWATFWTTIGTLIAALLAAVFTLGQWKTMNKTYEEIRAQTKNAIDVSRKQFSPYVLYDNGRIHVSKDGKRYNVSIQLKNFGETTAYSARHWITAQDMPRLTDPFKHFYPRSQPPVRFVNPGFDGIADIGGGQSICLQGEFAINGKSRGNAIYVWGDIKYADAFKRCEFEAFVLQGDATIAGGKMTKLSNVFNWASDTGKAKGECDDKGVAKLPWPEDEAPDTAVPTFSVFQGECPK